MTRGGAQVGFFVDLRDLVLRRVGVLAGGVAGVHGPAVTAGFDFFVGGGSGSGKTHDVGRRFM